jgi:hypothetical protein
MTEDDRVYEQSWHLDRKVPIALILAIIFQTAGIIWFAAGIYHRIETLERDAIARGPQGDRLTRVEVKLENVQEGITEIKRLIQRFEPPK